ncbi:MAG: YveK family protein [Chordicoccus sp.]
MDNVRDINQADEDAEIDLGAIFGELFRNLPIIILSAVVFGLAALLITITFVKPKYQSTTSIYVTSNETNQTTVDNNTLQAGTLLTKDYEEIIRSREVIQTAITDLKLSEGYDDLLKDLSVTTPDDTRVIYITITYTDPYTAANIANKVRDAAVSRIQEVIDIKSVKVVSPANVPDKKSSPSNTKNALIGALAGAFLAIIIILVRFLMNDTIKDAEDVEKYLHVSTLGTVPLAAGAKKSGKRHRRNTHGGRK